MFCLCSSGPKASLRDQIWSTPLTYGLIYILSKTELGAGQVQEKDVIVLIMNPGSPFLNKLIVTVKELEGTLQAI